MAENFRKIENDALVTPAPTEVELDTSAADLLDPAVDVEPVQVKPVEVIYVPFKDFEARVNQDTMYFRKDVPTRVTRDVAAMLLEDKHRGYVKD